MKILFFAPHSAIWVHAFPEALVAEVLAEHRHDILYVTCGREFESYCTPMTASGLRWGSPQEQKSRVCDSCERSANLIRSKFGFRGYSIESRVTPEDRLQIDAIVGNVTRENFLQLSVHGVAVGRYAAYELLLNHKKGNLEFTDAEWEEYRGSLRNSLAALTVGERLFREESPDRVIAYNSLYSVNRAVCMLAERRGIPTYFLHAGGNLARRLETLLMGRHDGVRFYEDMLAFWPKVRDLPCRKDLLAPVTNHIMELLSGRSFFSYSSARADNADAVREVLRIPYGHKILVATMSSPDERFAAETIGVMRSAESSIFRTQIDWIREVCAWVEAHPHLFLIIRVHPREFPNKREGVTSEHAKLLSQALSELPKNAVVNWPKDQISLYDLADIADVFLNAWSAAGKEMTLLGIPVVAYAADLLVYPPDLHYIGSSRADYFEKIGQALHDGWSIERARIAYRWCALEYERSTFDLHASFHWAHQRFSAKLRSFDNRIFMSLRV
jgi:hypothetical protein